MPPTYGDCVSSRFTISLARPSWSLCGILLQFGTRAEFLCNITFKHPGFCTYSCCSSPAAPWHRARPEVWARVAPSSSQKSLAGQRAQRGSVWAGHTSTTALSGASLSPGHQCASMQTEARLRSAPLCEELAPLAGNLAIVTPKSSESTG